MNSPTAAITPVRELGNCARALGDYRASAVLTGGFVPLMYRYLPQLIGTTSLPPLHTFDLDWAVPNTLAPKARLLNDQLGEAGFVVLLQGDRQPPVSRYQPAAYGQSPGPVYIEFLTPRKGSSEVHGKDRGVLEIQPGLTAQSLPYLGLLLHRPISFDLSVVAETCVHPGTTILLPGPMAFIMQKALARQGRKPEKRAGDQAHIVDVALLFQKEWTDLAQEASDLAAAPGFPRKWFDRAKQILADLYLGDDGPGPQEVTSTFNAYAGTTILTEATVRRVMREFVSAVGLA
jgi:hypothetical protein